MGASITEQMVDAGLRKYKAELKAHFKCAVKIRSHLQQKRSVGHCQCSVA